MWKHVWEATLYTIRGIAKVCRWIGFGLIAFRGWGGGFSPVKDFASFFLPKIILFLVGYFIIPLPLWVIAILAYLPPPAAGLIYTVIILVVLKQ